MRLLFLSIALFISTISFAQQTVTGTVSDESGETIPGATILELTLAMG